MVLKPRAFAATTLATALALGSLLGAPGCSNDGAPVDDENGVVVADGKADDFFSTTATEYVFKAKARVTVEPGQGLPRARELVSLHHTAIAWFLNQYLGDKEEEDANFAYGGYNAMAKTGAYEDLGITDLGGGVYEYAFTQTVGGPKNLMSKLPLRAGKLALEIGKPTNDEMAKLETNAEWYRQAPWDAWDPSKVGADKKEPLSFTVARDTASSDAFWDYARLIDDGKLTIDLHFGWDYHSNYHLKHSRLTYFWLKDHGFASPVATWEKYNRTSGPLVKHVKAGDRDVEIDVRIFYGKPGTDTDPDTDAGGIVLENDARESLAHSDVIVYTGHSGPFYGFALANWKKTDEGDLDDADIASLVMPAGKYQIVVAEGCDTYMLGQAFKDNPFKQGKNIDTITTTSFSNAETPQTVWDFITRLTETAPDGRLRPRPVSSLLDDVTGGEAGGFNTLYGVHGVDDNPHLNPFADTAQLCAPCTANAQCGATGNSCVKLTASSSKKVCAASCTADDGCPTGYACKAIASGTTIFNKVCVPKTLRCR